MPITKMPACVNQSDIHALGSGFGIKIHYFIASLYLLIILVSLVLNASVCHVYRMGYVRPNAYNKLVLNLAISGMVSALGIIPYVIVSPIMLRPLTTETANVLCTFTTGKLLFLVAMCVSTATITLISCHRFFSINNPTSAVTRFVQRDLFALLAGLFSWIFGIALLAPLIGQRQFESCRAMCLWTPDNWENRKLYLAFIVLLAYVVPTLILIATFATSIRTFWCSYTIRTGAITRTARRRIAVQLGLVIIAFLALWSPLLFYWTLLREMPLSAIDGVYYYEDARTMYVLVLIALLQSVVNPVLYGLRSPEFTRALSTRSQGAGTLERQDEATPLLR